MNSIVDIINKIEKRPVMYIGKNSILTLKAFLDGWYLRAPKTIIDGNIIDGFQESIEKKYNCLENKSWSDILMDHSKNESDSLDLFFKEFNEYKKMLNNDNA